MTPVRPLTVALALGLALAACDSGSGKGGGILGDRNPPQDPGSPPPPPPPPSTSCTDGQVAVYACGKCGTQSQSCNGGTWGPLSACAGEKTCAAYAQESESCGSDVGACRAGTRTRTCSYQCEWYDWSACGGAYVGPSEELCGNGIDDNCDGTVDEGCGQSIGVGGPVVKLASSPDGKRVYALRTGTVNEVIVFDAEAHVTVARVRLPQPADDMSLSPNGQHLVVSHDAVHQLTKLDLAANAVAMTKPVASDPYRIAVNDAGVVYYAELDQWIDIRRIGASLDFSTDTLLGGWPLYAADIALSPDGAFLYAGEGGLSGTALRKYDVSAGGLTQVDESTWSDGYGFPYPERWVLLGPSGARIYYAAHQLDAGNLAFTIGGTGGKVLAEDRSGTLAVGTRAVLDARTLRPAGTLSRDAAVATFANGDTELWYYHAASGRVFWQAKSTLADAAGLGVRDLAGEPLSAYVFSRLVRDPLRPLLYGLDATRGLVVAIAADTGLAVGAVLVGSQPTDLALSLDGDALYVGHLDTLALGRIDLATFTFDRFLVVPRVPFEVEALSSTRVAIIDEDQWTSPTLVDGGTGQILASLSWGAYAGALSATADGEALFVGDSGISGGNVVRYDVSAGALTQVSKSTYDHGYGFPYPSHGVLATPDGSGVYYAGFLLDGTNLAILRYVQSDPIRTVTPDGRLAISTTKVYRVSDGALLGILPVAGSVQAVSPDGATLYVSTPGAIAKVDLSAY